MPCRSPAYRARYRASSFFVHFVSSPIFYFFDFCAIKYPKIMCLCRTATVKNTVLHLFLFSRL
jgi:hypothetical protein